MQLVSLIIPTYNEAKNIPLLIEEIFSVIDTHKIDLEIIVVDDNSPDGTAMVVKQISARYPVRLISRAGKLGLGSAVREGFAASLREIIGVMDADLSHNPIILNQLINSLSDYDIAIGSRFEKESHVEQWAWWRKALSLTGVYFAKKLTGVHDPLSGYFFLRRSVIEKASLNTTGYKILLEILVKGTYQRVAEIPFNFRMRKYSTSKLNYREYFLFMTQLMEYSWYKLMH